MENMKGMSRARQILYRQWTSVPSSSFDQHPLDRLKLSDKKYPKPNDESSVIESSPPAQQSLPSPPSPKRPASSSSSSSSSSDAAPSTKRRRISHYQNAAAPQATTFPPVTVRSVESHPAPVATAQRKVRDASPAIKLISKIVNWNFEDVQKDLKTSNRYDGRYLDRENWTKAQFDLVKDLVWGRLHSNLKATSTPKTFTIKGIPDEVEVTGTGIKYLNCKCETKDNGYSLRTGTVLVVNHMLGGQRPEKFLGYITEYERNDGTVKFEMIVSMQYQNQLSRPAIVQIEASCNVQKFNETCDVINMALKFNLLEGIINPYCFIPSGKTPRDWMDPKNVYESVLKAYGTRNGFMTLVNDTRDKLMKKLIKLVEKLIQLSDHNNNRKISILITGLSVGTLALELAQRGIYEIDAPFEFEAKSFLRFNEDFAKASNDYRHTLNSIEIVLAPIHELPKLKEYRCDKFDVILMNDAAKITELDTLPALAFSPSSIILFGDEKHMPKDSYGLLKSDSCKPDKMKYRRNYFYRTIFHRFLYFGKKQSCIKKIYTK